ncbi:hypothetical protein [Streptomyces sp. NPDC000410]|uniref:hypothetical protein n=1 Tax=Streptomyces sp. NPDC000410 TaxID=3154254 RepID=UPI00332781D6
MRGGAEPLPVREIELEPLPGRTYPGHAPAGADVGVQALGVPEQVGNHLVPVRMALRVACERQSRQRAVLRGENRVRES